MPFRSAKDRVGLAKLESTYGTAPSMAAADAVLLMNASIKTIGDKLERNIDSNFYGGDPFVLVGKRVELDFEVDVLGHATPGTAPPLTAIYQACGWEQTLQAGVDASFKPKSTAQASATIDFFWAGVRFRMTGVRCSYDFEYAIKTYAKMKVKAVGLLTLPTDQEPPSGISFAAFQTPAAIETPTWLVSIGAYNAHCVSLMLNSNAELPLIETSESRQVVWVDRKPAGELIVVKNDTLATWNPWTIADGHNIVTITNTITGGAGKNLTMPIRAQLGYPEPTEYEGVAALKIPFTALANAGDDEFTVTFT